MGSRWVIAATVALVIAGCGSDVAEDDVTDPDAIRIASFDFDESRLVAELYAQVLEARGYATLRLGVVGPREVVAPALEQGLVDLVPEYLGTAAGHFGADSADMASLTAATLARGLMPLNPAPAQDVNVFVVDEATAEEHGLVTISDLAPVAAAFSIGGPVECPDRPFCLEGLGQTYALTFAEFVPQRSLTITAEALLRDEIDVGVMFSTAGELSAGPFVILDDDRGLQPAENIVPLARQQIIERWGIEFTDTLNSMSQLLTTVELQDMNRRVQAGESVEAVAADWLRSAGWFDG